MVNLNLDENEREVLGYALESYVSDLRMEIADTDKMDFREQLKTRKKVLNKIIDELHKF